MEIIIVAVITFIVLTAIRLHRLGLAREADEKWQAEDKLDRDEEWEAMGVWAREHPYKPKVRLPRLESLRDTRKGKVKA